MFTPKFNLYNAEWLDLVFDKRNKNYGAYELRNSYSNIMTRAMAITVFSIVAGALTLSILTRHHDLPLPPAEHVTKVDLTRVLPPPPENKPVKPILHTTTLQSHPSTVVIPTRITETEPVVEPPTIKEISSSAIGTEKSKGTDVTGTPAIDPPGKVGGTVTPTATGNSGTEILPFADVSPEPNGGLAGWSKFLQRNLRYPDSESQGRVVLSFVVERDGSLSDIKVLKSIGAEFDREAMRVLKMAPKWKPGMQSGQAVRVQFNIPINFQLQ